MSGNQKMFINRSKRKRSKALSAFLFLAIAVLVAFVGAYAWQSASGDQKKLEEKLTASPQSVTTPSSQPEAQASNPSTAPDSSEEPSTESSEDVPAKVAGAVTQSERVTSSYFDDAMFVGDSITNGILSYEIMKNATIISHVGINIDTIRYKEVFRKPDGSVTKIIDAMKDYPDIQKIYVMLGSNGIAWIDQTNFIKYYEEFLTEVIAQHPDAIIYVQSMFPVTASKEKADETFANAKINEYNKAIADMAQEMGCYYLNVADALKDEKGCLPEEASPSDGMHFGPQYYQKWFDYLKEHTVQTP